MPHVFVSSHSVCLYIYPRKAGFFVSITTLHSMVYANNQAHHGLKVVFVFRTLHSYLITIIKQTYRKVLNIYEMFVSYILSRARLRLYDIPLIIPHTIYDAGCIQLTRCSCGDSIWFNVYFIILLSSPNRKFESLSLCLGLGHKTMGCAACIDMAFIDE